MSSPNKRLKTTGQSSLTSFFAPAKSSATPKQPHGETRSSLAASQPTQQPAQESHPLPPTKDPIIPQTVPWSESKWRVYQNAVIYRKANDPPRPKVAAFDMDGTLVVWRSAGWPSNLNDYELWNTQVITKLRHLYDDEGYQLVIVSNQGAIRGAHTGKKATHVKNLVEWLLNTIDRPVSVVLSTDKKKGFHKPSISIWQAAQTLFAPQLPWSLAESVYVGDSVGDDNDPQGGVDIALARNVSQHYGTTLRFVTPDDFFGPSHAAQRSTVVQVHPVPAPVQATRAALCSGNLRAPLLLLLCGAQGSGKSTLAAKIVDNHAHLPWVHYSQDTINHGQPGRREQVEAAVAHALQAGHAVICDRMHLDPAQRRYFVRLAQNAGVPVHCLVLQPPAHVLTQRVQDRAHHPGGVQGQAGAKIAAAHARKLVVPVYDTGKADTTDEGLALISVTAAEPTERWVQLYRGAPPGVPTEFLVWSNHHVTTLPAVVLGTMKLGRKAAADVVTQALRRGIRGVDTAPTYHNEDKVGPALSADTFCIVKVPKRASSADQVQAELQASLTNLQRTHVDLLLLHWPCLPADALKDVWQAMEAAVDQGTVRALGLCNANMAALAGLLPQCRVPPAVLQVERHPLLPQWDLVDFCARHDIQLQAHTPLGQGAPDLLEHAVVQKVAAAYPDTSAAQVLLAWNVQQGVAVVVKASTPSHLRELTQLPQLTPSDLQRLNDITDHKRFVAPPFMYGTAPYCWGTSMPK